MFKNVETYPVHKRKRFFNRDLETGEKLNNPHPFNTFCELVRIAIANFNLNCKNDSIFKKMYSNYLIKFESSPKLINPIDLGLDPNYRKLQYYLDRGWSDIEAREKLKYSQGTLSVDAVSTKYNISKEEALIKIKKITDKQNISRKKNPEYYNNKKKNAFPLTNRLTYLNKINPETGLIYTESEISQIIKNYLSEYSKKSNKTKRERDSFNSNTSLRFYLNKGLSISDAIAALRERQGTNSLSRYIQRYGEEKGTLMFNERQIKWQNTLNSKSDSEKFEILKKKCSGFKMYSGAAMSFFNKLVEYLNFSGISNLTYYYGTNEKFIYDHDNKKIYFYDFYIPELKYYIEFNGIAYHVDPNRMSSEKWNSWVHPYSKRTAQEQYDYDSHKLSLITNNGGSYYIVWEDSEIEKTYTELLSIIDNKQKQLLS